MKLDIECLRDVLICVEENTGLHKSCVFYDVPAMEKSCNMLDKVTPDVSEYQQELLKKYENDALFYHVLMCVEGDLIKRTTGNASYEAVISGMTFEGHDFLESIRNPSIWKKIKDTVIESGGKLSFEMVKELAKLLGVAFVKSLAVNQGLSP